eukprot:g562.t1
MATPAPTDVPEDPPDTNHATQVLATLSAGASVCGSLYILHHYKEARKRGRPTVSNQLIAILSLMDLVFSFNFGIGQGWQKAGSGACDFQGFMVQMSLSAVLWTTCIGHHLYQWVVMREHEDKRRARLNTYLAVSVGTALLFAVVYPMADNGGTDAHYYDEGILWCWIREFPWQMGIFYIWVLLGWLINGWVFFRVRSEIKSRALMAGSEEAKQSTNLVIMRTSLYLGVFVCIWFFGLLNRILSFASGKPVLATSVLHAMFVPLQGFLNSLVYGGLWERFYFYFEQTVASRSRALSDAVRKGSAAQTWLPQKRKSSTGRNEWDGSRELIEPKFKSELELRFELFVSTWNMGECKVPPNLDKWIPRGKDLYVIGLQECMHRSEMSASILRYLNSGPSVFRDSTSESGREEYVIAKDGERAIGSTKTTLGFHGHIALTLFVRASLQRSGVFEVTETARTAQEVNRGKNLGAFRAANKGAVGVPCRLGSSTLAFVTCHLASDSKGKSKIEKRNTDAHEILQNLSLTVDEEGYDLPHMQHHTIFMGDLNYRNMTKDARPNEILGLVTTAMGRKRRVRALERLVAKRLEAEAERDQWRAEWRERGGQLALALPPLPVVRAVATRHAPVLNAGAVLSGLEGSGATGANARVAEGGGGAAAAQSTGAGAGARRPDGSVIMPVASKANVWSSGKIVNRQKSQELSEIMKMDDEAVLKSIEGVEEVELEFGSEEPGADAVENPLTAVSNGGGDAGDAGDGDGDPVSLHDALRRECDAEAAAWEEVMSHDELVQCMRAGEVFAGFIEEPIAFPPSYRRKRGLEGDCADYCDQKRLEGAFSTEVKGAGLRVPSYTDRILLHSLDDVRNRIQIHRHAVGANAAPSSTAASASAPASGSGSGAGSGGRSSRSEGVYYLCDELVESDHRPICAEYSLTAGEHAHQRLEFEYSHDKKSGRASKLGDGSPTPPRVPKHKNARRSRGAFWSHSSSAKMPSRLVKAPLEYTVTIRKLEVEWAQHLLQLRPIASASGMGEEEEDGVGGEAGAVDGEGEPRADADAEGEADAEVAEVGSGRQRRGTAAGRGLRALSTAAAAKVSQLTTSLNMDELLHSHGDTPHSLDDGLSVTAQFPLPSEDIFSAQRKVHLIQDEMNSMLGAGPTSARGQRHNHHAKRDSVWRRNICKADWAQVQSGDQELVCVAQGRELKGLHLLLKFERGLKRQGEAVVILAPAAEALGKVVPFSVPLVSGGRRTGVATGEVVTTCKRGRVKA